MSTHATAVLNAPLRPGRTGPDDLAAYSERVFGRLPRSDQRRWAGVYLSGLLSTPGRKSGSRMAQILGLPSSAAQSLQQFITSSPWDWEAPRRELARIAADVMPHAVWTTAAVLLRRGGTQSVGLQRLAPESGRHVNCQVGIGLFLTDGRQSIPVHWQLVLNDAWCDDPERRRRARIPHDVTPRPVWALTLDMINQAAADRVAVSAPLVYSLDHSRDPSRLVAQLNQTGRDFLIEVAPHQPFTAILRGSNASEPATMRTSTAAGLLEHHFRSASPTRGQHARLCSVTVQFHSPRATAPAARRALRLVAEIPAARRQSSRFWVTSLRDTPPHVVHTLALRSELTALTVERLQHDLGLLDFEGRTFPGWHHHMTLASAAYLYRCLG
ncbi:transposase [Streptomyces sp. NPDC004232]|uniref:IS701 family transposase n=1 Tax=Streptomyces sp. NPDC004232 TaxID=3154454 RepID=UPI001D8EF2F0|nr:transposase [Streptomyces sp. tea 10]